MTKEELSANMRKLGEQFRANLEKLNKVSMIYGFVRSVDRESCVVDCETLAGYTLHVRLNLFETRHKTVRSWPAIDTLVVIGFVEDDPSASFLIEQIETEEVEIEFKEGASVSVTKDRVRLAEGGSSASLSGGKIALQAGEGAFLNLSDLPELMNLKSTLLGMMDATTSALSALRSTAPNMNVDTKEAIPILELAKSQINQKLK